MWRSKLVLLSALACGAISSAQVAADANEQHIVEKITPTPDTGGFDWRSATRQSINFTALQHTKRFFERKTRRELRGPLLKDYFTSVRGIRGWRDGDTFTTNYVGHPIQGAVSTYIYIHNSPANKHLQFGSDGAYWKGRLQGMAWAAAMSMQFEIGPLSEAMIGNVGKKPGTAGMVDLVVTPTGGFALTIGEDALDRYVIMKVEGNSRKRQFLYRTFLNPSRAIANLVTGRAPWYRDSRPITSTRMGADNPQGVPRPSYDQGGR